jgi:ribosomal protein L11 methyltransferase
MPWQRIALSLNASIADAFADALLAAGAVSASIEQDRSLGQQEHALFGEPDDPEHALWPDCLVDALFDLDSDPGEAVKAASLELALSDVPAFTMDTVEDQDWVRNTQRQFDPIPISHNLWIVPTWHTPPNDDAINIRLDPGQAFGTGSHPTTRLCLEWLATHAPQGQILDYGCGSGILAIAAKKLGAAKVVGVDLDPLAIEAAHYNALQNRVEASFGEPDLDDAKEEFDVVIANILTRPLIALAPLLTKRVKPGGHLVLSGILSRQVAEVEAAYRAAGISLIQWGPEEEWACLVGQRLS